MQVINDKHILNDQEMLEFLGVQQQQDITPASTLTELAIESFEDGDKMAGLQLPWHCTHDRFALRQGEVTLWAGYNGHGKTLLLGQICALTMQVEKWLIASMEMPVRATVNRLVRHMGGIGNPSSQYITDLMKLTEDRLWIYDQITTVKGDNILAMIHYAATKLGVTQIIIDSLVKCGLGVEDWTAQKDFVDNLCHMAKQYNIHIHLVHHVRKGINESTPPGKMDIKGAGEITDLVDNVAVVHRNKMKEIAARDGNEVKEFEPDASLTIHKQRHAGIEDEFPLYFHADSQQYLTSPRARTYQLEVQK